MIHESSIQQLAASLATGKTTSQELVERCIKLAESNDHALRSFITIAIKEARIQAALSDERRRANATLGLLDGIPYGAKDVFPTRGIRTTAGSKLLQHWVPTRSAGLIRQLESAGAVLLGKTNLHEFSYGATGENEWTGTATNPHDTTRIAGGSSGGSAAAVAASIVPFSLGTDTGGSVRVPAALCGVAGFKPTSGLISLEGAIPFCWSLDHAGLIGATASDLITVAGALRLLSVTDHPLRSLRVGLVAGWCELAEPAVQRGYEAAKAKLTSNGTIFEEIALPDQAEARTVSLTIQLSEALSYHSSSLKSSKHLLGSDIRSGLLLGQFISAESYIQCKRLITAYRSLFSECFRFVDLLLTPACPVVAPTIGSKTITVGDRCMPTGNALTLFTSFFNLVGAPAVVIPAGTDERGLPVGVQIVGKPNDDAKVLAVAAQIESTMRECIGDRCRKD